MYVCIFISIMYVYIYRSIDIDRYKTKKSFFKYIKIG